MSTEPVEPEADVSPFPVEPGVDDVPLLFGLPLNRVVAFLGPALAVISGALANWLFVNVNILSAFDVGQNEVAQAITQILVFGITALVVYLGQHKWLDGYQKWAYQNAPAAQPVIEVAGELPPQAAYDPAAEAKALEVIDQGVPPRR